MTMPLAAGWPCSNGRERTGGWIIEDDYDSEYRITAVRCRRS